MDSDAAIRDLDTGAPDGRGNEDDSGLNVDAFQAEAPDLGVVDIPDRQFWSATASSSSTCCNDAVSSAFDGELSTRWSTGKSQMGNEWFRLDIGAIAEMSEVSLDSLADTPGNGTEYPSAYVLELSTDDLNYFDVASGKGASLTKVTFARRLARYAKIKQVGSTASWWSIHELTVTR